PLALDTRLRLAFVGPTVLRSRMGPPRPRACRTGARRTWPRARCMGGGWLLRVGGGSQRRARYSAQLLVHVVVADLDVADARIAAERRLHRALAPGSRVLVRVE